MASSPPISPPNSPHSFRFSSTPAPPDPRSRTKSNPSPTHLSVPMPEDRDRGELDPFARAVSNPAPFTPYTSFKPPSVTRKPKRTSILGAASDAFGAFALGRRKTMSISKQATYPRQPEPIGDVLEISASNSAAANFEEAERVRLRDAAAQAIGMNPTRDIEQDDDPSPITKPPSIRSRRSSITSALTQPTRAESTFARQAIGSATTLPPLGSAEPDRRLPPFPSSPATLRPLIQTSSVLLKFCPSPSPLLILSRSRQWKIRHLVLTSITSKPTASTSGTPPRDAHTISHLHLFKSGGADERELERLEINEDSIVYIADEEAPGRKFVIKIGGIDKGGAKKKEALHGVGPVEQGMTVWLLQLHDSPQMHRWIQYIKSTVLMQRAQRAGLGMAAFYPNNYNSNGPELKGDLDVMLSMGKQGLLSSAPLPPQVARDPNTPVSSYSSNSTGPSTNDTASSSGSYNRPRPVTAPAPSAAVHALKGLFNSGRPVSRQLSIATTGSGRERPTSPLTMSSTTNDDDASIEETSLTNRANALFNLFRPSSPAPTNPLPPPPIPPISVPIMSPDESALHRSPSPLHHSSSFSIDWESIDVGTTDKHLSVGSMSLAPPPRTRRPMTTGSAATSLYRHRGASVDDLVAGSDAESMTGAESRHVRRKSVDTGNPASIAEDWEGLETGPTSPSPRPSLKLPTSGSSSSGGHSTPHVVTPTQFPSSSSSFGHASPTAPTGQNFGRPPSRSSMGSHTSDRERELERTNSGRRRSRSGPIPRQLSPPNGPPPSIPHRSPSPILENSSHEPERERTSSDRSSPYSVRGHGSSMSASLSAILYSKRMSSSSARSVTSVQSGSTTQSRSPSFLISRITPSSPAGSSSGGQASARSSLHPPPQRPTPTFAPPPLPLEAGKSKLIRPSSAGTTATPSRSEFSQRLVRLSLPPAPPPHIALPARPDEPTFYHPYRSNSMSSSTATTPLYTIPGSPARFFNDPPLGPPPTIPLPATPDNSNSTTPTLTNPVSPSVARLPSLRLRLRLANGPPSPGLPSWIINGPSSPPLEPLPQPPLGYTPPASPIGEPILPALAVEHAALSARAPTPPPRSLARPLPTTNLSSSPVGTSLSPPPRRNSRASNYIPPPSLLAAAAQEKAASVEKAVMISPRDSAVHLGIGFSM